MTENAQAGRRSRNIVVDSDWITTFGAIALLIVCVLLFARDARNLIWGHLRGPAPLHKSFWSIWNLAFETIAAIYLFMFAFKLTQKAARIACGLMGVRLGGFVLLSCFDISHSARRVAAVSGSIVSQVALVIFCVAIAQWLKSVVRRDAPPQPRGGDH